MTLLYPVALGALCIFLFEDCTSYFTRFVTNYTFSKQNLVLHFAFDLSLIYCLPECNYCNFCKWNSFLMLNLWLNRIKTKFKLCSWNKWANTTEVRRVQWQTAPQWELQVISLPIKAGPGEDFTQLSNPWGRWTNKVSQWRMALRSVTLWTWPK